MKQYSILVTIISLFIAQMGFAAIEKFDERAEGSAITSTGVEVYDGKYFDMMTNSNWSNEYTNYQIKNTVQLGINPDVLQTATFSGSIDVLVEYEYWNSGAFVWGTAYTRTLAVDYDINGAQLIDDLSTFVFSGASRVRVTVQSVTGLNVNDLFLESTIEVERYYAFDGGTVANASHTTVGTNNDYIEFNWDHKVGAEFYELEWVHINDYKVDHNQFFTTSELSFNYYLNSTRILLRDNSYKIPKIFDHGYLIYRIRPIGLQGANFEYRYDGDWTAAESGSLASHPSAQRYFVNSSFDDEMNWVHLAGYSEDGRRVEKIVFADGLGRTRQSVRHNTITEQAIVSNVYYDEMGRPAISDLGTPVDGEQLRHYPNFNRSEIDPNESFRADFFDDGTSDPNCVPIGLGMSDAYGAGKYYSPNNPDNDGENAYVPDSDNFPFSRVHYLNDYTGRIMASSAAGDELNMGSGRETRYYYPSTNQEELNTLFGSEVGFYEHYQKMITVDPNGQVYVQYMDLGGRVVASYMMGESPENLVALANNNAVNETVHIVQNGSSQSLDQTVPSTSVSYGDYFDEGVYTFDYGFTTTQYQNSGCAASICFDCVYDLTLTIRDECGNIIETVTQQINGAAFNDLCDEDDSYDYTNNISLTAGFYVIEKTLSVNQDAIQEYWCFYIDAYTCEDDISEFFNVAYENEEFTDCDPEEYTESGNECDAIAELMQEDVSPGGQYAEYEVSGAGVYSTSDPTSIFYNSAWTTYTYTDENNDPILVTDPSSGLDVSPASLSMEEFIQLFDESWAPSLNQQHHPEYCYLVFCRDNSASHSYDQDMMDEDSYDDALSTGYFNPLNVTLNTGISEFDNSTSVAADPFFASTFGSSYLSAMQGVMDSYITIFDPVTQTNVTLNMWEYAVYLAHQDECSSSTSINDCIRDWKAIAACNNDLVWIYFRQFYLEAKSAIMYDAMHDYAYQNECLNDCIGSAAIGCEDYADKFPRWGNNYQDIDGNGTTFDDIINDANPATAAGNLAATMGADACEMMAEQIAAQWMNQLSGCDFAGNGVNTTDLQSDMEALLIAGCDENHPQGATTTPNGVTVTTQNGTQITSLDELLEDYLGTGYESNLCTELLISQPGPYQTNEEAASSIVKPLDGCGCDYIYEAEALVTAQLTIEEALYQLTGISMDDADYLLCACDDAITGTWTSGYNWSAQEIQDLEDTELTIPAELACEACDVDCEDITTQMENLATRFSSVTDFENSTNYELIVTNFLNQAFDYTLVYADYERFIGKCGASEDDPYCEVNPLMSDWSDMMTLVAYRGQLMNGSGNQVDLETENIVYEHSDIFGVFGTHDYWSEVVGTTFKMHFGSGGTACTFEITHQTFDFSSIVSFGSILPTSNSCSENSDFQIEVDYIDCGEVQTTYLTGTSDCFDAALCVCNPEGLTLCNEPYAIYDGPCYEPELSILYQNALDAYLAQISDIYVAFEEDYNAQCSAAFDTEDLSYTGNFRRYQYTLFYYDQAGNLIRTVAPEGIDELPASQNSNINDARENLTAPVLPVHDYITEYKYNSYDQLESTTNPDQDGDTRFWYDRYGRIVASQNPVQADENKYGYTIYDDQGRPVEIGQAVNATSLDLIDLELDDLGTTFESWVAASTRSEVTVTTYDRRLSAAIETKFANQKQENLRLRVATVAYFKSVNGGTDYTTDYESATHYSYDVHGNVIEQLQDVPMMSPVNLDIKSTQYEFEVVSGNVKSVSYQEGELDYFKHSYEYDDQNRLTEVYTTIDDVHHTRESHYRYYDYGPLARTEIGKDQVQGEDYTYTINGWIKAKNASDLDSSRDMGKDGTTGYSTTNSNIHERVAKDMIGYTMSYFSGDYSPIGTSTMEIVPSAPFANSAKDLYNGNVSRVTTAIYNMTPMGSAYEYDQLNRLKSMSAYYLGAGPSWSASTDYFNDYEYDMNGNITSLTRNATTALGLYMDEFAYHLQSVGGDPSNRLDYVNDTGVNDGLLANDGSDIRSGMTAGNYQYDKIGQLISDASESISTIHWRKGDKKVLKIERNDADSPELEFVYNPLGIRVCKITKPRSGGQLSAPSEWVYTFYGIDANDNTMAIYDATINGALGTAHLTEQNIYAKSRLGQLRQNKLVWWNGEPNYGNPDVFGNTIGQRYYELGNHLRNVLAVINDRKTVASGGGTIFDAVAIMTSDYYPFGMVMPGRSWQADESTYRYAYNGMEADGAIKGERNSYTTQFRQYDPRLGLWLSIDPLTAEFPSNSPYQAYNNNPIYFVDPLGLKGEPYSNWDIDMPARRVERESHDNDHQGRLDYVWNIEGAQDGTVIEFVYPGEPNSPKHVFVYDRENNIWNDHYSYNVSSSGRPDGIIAHHHYQWSDSEKNRMDEEILWLKPLPPILDMPGEELIRERTLIDDLKIEEISKPTNTTVKHKPRPKVSPFEVDLTHKIVSPNVTGYKDNNNNDTFYNLDKKTFDEVIKKIGNKNVSKIVITIDHKTDQKGEYDYLQTRYAGNDYWDRVEQYFKSNIPDKSFQLIMDWDSNWGKHNNSEFKITVE